VYDDPASLLWCAGLLGVGVVLFLVEYVFGRRGGSGTSPDAEVQIV
jgi:SNF family Na+-dependent transporter